MRRIDKNQTPIPPLAFESGGEPVSSAPVHQVGRFRRLIKKAIIYAGVAGVVLVGPHVWDRAFGDRHQDEVQASNTLLKKPIDGKKKQSQSRFLEMVQGQEVKRLFGKEKIGSKIKNVAESSGNIIPLNAADFIDDPQFNDVTTDGKNFWIDGRICELVRKETKEGVFILVKQQVRAGIESDDLIVGGAINKEGMPKEVLIAQADESARVSLAEAIRSFKKPHHETIINPDRHVGKRKFLVSDGLSEEIVR